MPYRLSLLIFTISICSCYAQTKSSDSSSYLLLANRKNPDKNISLAHGQKIKIVLLNGQERKIKILRLDSVNIYSKNDQIALTEIYSIAKIRSGLDILGGTVGGVGCVLLFSSVAAFSSVADEQVRTEVGILGGSLTALGVMLLHRKTHSKRHWDFIVVTPKHGKG